MYEELITDIRYCVSGDKPCGECKHIEELCCDTTLMEKAGDAIEQLLKAAKKMHLWIFLHSGDEQEAYDWCGLSDEMNAALGYGGQFEIRAEPPETLYYPQVDGVTPMVVVPKEEI